MASPAQTLYAKLKPGPGKSSLEVRDNQRSRLHSAIVELAAEVGFERITVRGLTSLAGVSTATFYKHFVNVDDCFASAYEALARSCLRRTLARREACDDWEEGLRVVIRSLIEETTRHPRAACALAVETFAAGPRTQARVRSGSIALERLLCGGPGAAQLPAPVRRHLPRAIAAGLTRVVRTRLLSRKRALPETTIPELEAWALSVYGAGLNRLELPLSHQPVAADRSAAGVFSSEIFGAAADERARILTAVTRLSLAHGFTEVTVGEIRAQAGVSRSGFRSRFADSRECFVEAIETIATSTAARAQLSARHARDWEAACYRVVQTLCAGAAQHPAIARLSLVDVFTPGREGFACQERLTSIAADRLRSTSPPDRQPTPLQSEAAVAAAWSIAHTEAAAARATHLPGQVPLLAYLTMVPVIGSEAAAAAVDGEQGRLVRSA